MSTPSIAVFANADEVLAEQPMFGSAVQLRSATSPTLCIQALLAGAALASAVYTAFEAGYAAGRGGQPHPN